MHLGLIALLLAAGTPAQASVCSDAWRDTMSCNGPGFGRATFVADTIYESDRLEGYACETKPHTAAERIMRFSCDYDTSVRLVMSNTRCDLDLFVLEGSCNPNDASDCVAVNETNFRVGDGAGTQFPVEFFCFRGLEYYVVVENRVSTGPACGVLNGDYTGDGISNITEQGPGSNVTLTPYCPENCADGYDNDRSGQIDCADPACQETCCDRDGDGVWQDTVACGNNPNDADPEDCDDDDPLVYDGAPEVVADGVDQDCDAVDDCYVDDDDDGFGGADTIVSNDLDCLDPIGEADNADDCDDADGDVYPGGIELVADGVDGDCFGGDTCWRDVDGDGFGVPSPIVSNDLDCADAGESARADDCDDAAGVGGSRYPGAPEVAADGVDQDCDGVDACYVDADGDGWGSNVTVPSEDLVCGDGDGFANRAGDCADVGPDAALIRPDATETCNGRDDDCDGLVDDADAGITGASTWYRDLDGDGYGTAADAVQACAAPVGYVARVGDCLDVGPVAAGVNPAATEVPADAIDQDCDGQDLCWADLDGDGFGVPTPVLGGDLLCGNAAGESSRADDCDDAAPGASTRYPGAPETCNGLDDDCDLAVDDADPDRQGGAAWFVDQDGDGYAGDATVRACAQPPGAAAEPSDCVDVGPGAAQVNPGAAEAPNDAVDQDCDGQDACYADLDGDGFGTVQLTPGGDLVCGNAPGESARADDCLDAGAGAVGVYPGAIERCDGFDNDCDLLVDDADPSVSADVRWYVDQDQDGFAGDATVFACSQPAGTAEAPSDCRDAGPGAAAIFPGATEVLGDAVDQDCDGGDACWSDLDGDGYGGVGAVASPNLTCGDQPGEAAVPGDCQDDGLGASAVFPGATEVCNGLDDDCDGRTDDADFVADPDTWYGDADGDGYPGAVWVQLACVAPPGFAAAPSDCDDARRDISPGVPELCNGFDDDCDGLVDDADTIAGGITAWVDGDGDGAGDPDRPEALNACRLPEGYVGNDDDCDDARADVGPGAAELPYDGVDQDCVGGDLVDVDGDGARWGVDDCDDGRADIRPLAVEQPDGADQDCDGLVDEGTAAYDDDGDGFAELGEDCDDASVGVHPGAVESCDGVDEDCDGRVDEGTRCVDDDGDGLSEEDGDCHDGDADVRPGAPDAGPGVDWDCDGVLQAVDPDGDGYATGDCAPDDAAIRPGAAEVIDGIDQDCDGRIDEGTTAGDDDGDGLSEDAGDCYDGAPAVRPGAAEVPGNYVDDDCDGVVDEGSARVDDDGDGFAEEGGDCDDADPSRFPGAEPGPSDQDCDGLPDPTDPDMDGDGFTEAEGDCDDRNGYASPEAVEVCDGVDNDCDGVIDAAGCDDTAPAPAPEAAATSCGCSADGRGGGAVALAWAALLARRRRR